jgi:hypothetical protein
MKYFLIIFFTIVCTSCRSQLINKENNLTSLESDVVNDFLNVELKEELYKNYKDYEIIIIEDAAGNGIKSLNAYEYAYKDFHSRVKDVTPEINSRLGWIIDSLEIIKFKEKLINSEPYKWKVTDFKNIKVKLRTFEELIKTTNTGKYLKKNLIIHLSRPLLINQNYALISFDIGNGDLGFNAITHFTALMKKNNDKWVLQTSYWDGVIN